MAEGVFIKDVKLPECCGECFAFDTEGCKFIKLDPSDKGVWEKRHADCPMLRCRTSCALSNKV